MLKLYFLVCVLALASPCAFAAGAPAEIVADARAFLKMADRVNGQEPELYPNPAFGGLQKYTMKYERYASSQEAGHFKRVFLVPGNSLSMAQLEKAYVKYAKEATSLSQTLIPYVTDHVSLITDAAYAKKYKAKYAGVMKTLFPDASGKLQEFKVFDCDYTTQPTDAFWYTFHATRILDAYGTALFGPSWALRRDELRKQNQLGSLEELRRAVEPGLPEEIARKATNINALTRSATEAVKKDCPPEK